jgi:hypothetical protein
LVARDEVGIMPIDESENRENRCGTVASCSIDDLPSRFYAHHSHRRANGLLRC